MKSILIRDTTREEREALVHAALSCGESSCENCSSCSLGGGDPYAMYQSYIDGEKELAEINAAYAANFLHG